MVQSDPKRQSQLLMQSKRRSLAIKDTDLLEQMLRGDLEAFDSREEEEEEEDEYTSDKEEEAPATPLPINPPTIELPQPPPSSCLTCDGFPCTFPCSHTTRTQTKDPFAFLTGLTIILGFASQLGITDDWTVPITLATLVSTFLWTSNQKKKPDLYKKSI